MRATTVPACLRACIILTVAVSLGGCFTLYKSRPGRAPCRTFTGAPHVAFAMAGLAFMAIPIQLTWMDEDEPGEPETTYVIASLNGAIGLWNIMVGVQGLDYETCDPDDDPAASGKARAGPDFRDVALTRVRPDGRMEVRIRSGTTIFVAHGNPDETPLRVHVEVAHDRVSTDQKCALMFDDPVMTVEPAPADLPGGAAGIVSAGRLLALARVTVISGSGCRKWGLRTSSQKQLIQFLETLKLVRHRPSQAPVPPAAAGAPVPSATPQHPTRDQVNHAMALIRDAIAACSEDTDSVTVEFSFESTGALREHDIMIEPRARSLDTAIRDCVLAHSELVTMPPFTREHFDLHVPFRLGPMPLRQLVAPPPADHD